MWQRSIFEANSIKTISTIHSTLFPKFRLSFPTDHLPNRARSLVGKPFVSPANGGVLLGINLTPENPMTSDIAIGFLKPPYCPDL